MLPYQNGGRFIIGACPIELHEIVAEESLKYSSTQVLDGLAKRFGRKKNTIRTWLASIENAGIKVRRPYSTKRQHDDLLNDAPPLTKEELFENAFDEYRGFIGMSDKHKSPKVPKSKVGLRRKVVAISDIHGNPHLPGIKKAIDEKPDLFLLVGDIFDNFSLSRFDKEKFLPIEQEMANIRALAETISAVCPSRWASGNHDKRAFAYFCKRVDSQFMRFVHTDMIGMSLVGLENCTAVNNMHGFTTSGGVLYKDILSDVFMICEGDAVLAHSESSRKGELNTVRGFREWYSRWASSLGLPNARLLAQAHVHRAGIGFPNGGHCVDVEMGCMLSPETIGYALAGDTKYSPPTHGYLVFEQSKVSNNWVTDLSSVRFVLC